MAGLTTAPYVAFFISIWIVSPTVADQKEVTAKAGQDVTVDCRTPRDAEILLLKWSRSDLKSEGYVFFVRENRHYESAQHPSYHGRVELRDPQMKAGDVSVVVKNANVNDTGTYEFRVSTRSRETATEFSHFIKLTVTESDTKNITAKPGQDVRLHCQGPRGAVIGLIGWNRPDLESDKYVFFLRENHTNENYQLPSYRGRVDLSDPETKDGNASVVLKNVSVNDTGTYECGVIIRRGDEPKLYSTIKLNMTDSGHTDGPTVGRGILGLPVIVVIFIALFFLFYTKKISEKAVAAENEKEKLFQDLFSSSTPTDYVATTRDRGNVHKYT
ncbi:coxsackievirus and adenovirus receptor homolog isoform X2 [Sander vitreus]